MLTNSICRLLADGLISEHSHILRNSHGPLAGSRLIQLAVSCLVTLFAYGPAANADPSAIDSLKEHVIPIEAITRVGCIPLQNRSESTRAPNDPNACYSNIDNFSGAIANQGPVGPGGAPATGIARMLMDDIHGIGTCSPLQNVLLSLGNGNTMRVAARMRIRIWAADGAGGGPGTFITGFNSANNLNCNGNSACLYLFDISSFNVTLPQDSWAGIAYDNGGTPLGGDPVATNAQLANIGQGIWNPPVIGSSQDRDWLSTGTTTNGFNGVNSPAGVIRLSPFGASPIANYGWEFDPTPPSGACCNAGSCTQTTAASCAGVWAGAGTVCGNFEESSDLYWRNQRPAKAGLTQEPPIVSLSATANCQITIPGQGTMPINFSQGRRGCNDKIPRSGVIWAFNPSSGRWEAAVSSLITSFMAPDPPFGTVISVAQSSTRPVTGRVISQSFCSLTPSFPADSYFDQFLEITLEGFPSPEDHMTLFNTQPLRLEAVVTEWPPVNHTYVSSNTVDFYERDGGPPVVNFGKCVVQLGGVIESPALYGTLYNGPSGSNSSYTFAKVSTVDGHVTPLFDFALPFGLSGMAYDPKSGNFVALGYVAGAPPVGKVVEIKTVTHTLAVHDITGLPLSNLTNFAGIEYDPTQYVPSQDANHHFLVTYGQDANPNLQNRIAALNPTDGTVSHFTDPALTIADGDAIVFHPALGLIITDSNNPPFRVISNIFTAPTFTDYANPPADGEYYDPACSEGGTIYFSRRATHDLWRLSGSSYVLVGPLTGATPTAFAIGLAFGTAPECVPAPDNLVAWWPLDELAGGAATDIVGGHNGTHVNSATPLAGLYVDNSLCFDGIDDYVNVPDDAALNFGTGDFSIDAWIKTTQTSGVRVIVDKRLEAGPGTIGYSLFLNSGFLAFQIADGSGSSSCASCPTSSSCTNYTSTASVATGNWEHVAVTVSRTTDGGKFYVNGASVAVFNPDCHANSITNANPLRIGSRSSSVSGVFDGCIDEVELFNRVLGPAEVADIAFARQAGKCKCRCLGDMNGDSALNGQDIAGFIQCLLSGSSVGCLCADISGDGHVTTSLDIAPFVVALLAKTPCL